MLFNCKLLVILLASVYLVNSLNTVNFPDDLYLIEANEKYKPIGFDEYIVQEDDSPPENILNHKILPSSELYDLGFPKEVHDQQTPIRFRRSPADEKNGNVNVDVSRTRDQGTNIHVDASRDVWKSHDGRTKVEAGGNYDRNIGGRQPGQPKQNYGGHATFSHRWRRSPQFTPPFNPQGGSGNPQGGFGNADRKNGNVNVDVSRTRDQGTNVHLDASGNVWQSHDGRTKVEAGGNYDRNIEGRQPGQPKQNYGGHATFSHRWRRSPQFTPPFNPQGGAGSADRKNGNVNVDVSRTRDQGTNVHLDASGNVWQSRDGRTKVEAGGNYDRNIGGRQPGQPKQNYGGHATFSHRWRRSPQFTPPFNPQGGFGNPQGGFRNPNAPHGNVNIGIGHQTGGGTQLHLGANQDFWRSRNGMTSFQGGVSYDRNLGRTFPGMPRDNFGGQIQFNHRF